MTHTFSKKKKQTFEIMKKGVKVYSRRVSKRAIIIPETFSKHDFPLGNQHKIHVSQSKRRNVVGVAFLSCIQLEKKRKKKKHQLVKYDFSMFLALRILMTCVFIQGIQLLMSTPPNDPLRCVEVPIPKPLESFSGGFPLADGNHVVQRSVRVVMLTSSWGRSWKRTN